jgi:hypothetical protein
MNGMEDPKGRYFELLKKYICHVGDYEGTTFLENHQRTRHSDCQKFTDEEWTQLQSIDAEMRSFTHSPHRPD